MLVAKTRLKAWRLNVLPDSRRRYFLYPCAWPLLRSDRPRTLSVSSKKIFLIPQLNHLAGVGHQAAKWMAAFSLAKRYGLTFVHSPFNGGWEDLLGFGDSELREKDLPRNTRKWTVPYFSGEDAFDSNHDLKKIIYSLSNANPHLLRLELDQGLVDFSDSIDTISGRFHLKHPELACALNRERKIKIALHVRRGDIIGLKEKRQDTKYIRFLPEEYYSTIMQRLSNELAGLSYEFHIFTDGKADDFEILRHHSRVIWHDNETAHATFLQLVAADILVMGRSGFSFLAAMISRGVKIVSVPWWHKIPDYGNWIQIDIEGGKFICDTALLKGYNFIFF